MIKTIHKLIGKLYWWMDNIDSTPTDCRRDFRSEIKNLLASIGLMVITIFVFFIFLFM